MPDKPKRLPRGVIALDTPPAILDAARSLPGWAYASSFTTRDSATGRVCCELHLAHRGGFLVPDAAFRTITGPWRVKRVHSHVSGGQATVWLHLERVP
jgi:hypothetical protein